MFDPTVITELDMLDAERAQFTGWAQCDHCDTPALVAALTYQAGDHLCNRCYTELQADWQHWLRSARYS